MTFERGGKMHYGEQTGRISCSQAALNVLDDMRKRSSKPLTYDKVMGKVLDENRIDGFFQKEHEVMVFIAENLEEAAVTMNDFRMYRRYSARLDPFKDPVAFADAMIERKALEIAINGFREKPQAHINLILHDDRTFEELVSTVSGRMRYDMAFGCTFDIVSMESMGYGLDAAHTTNPQAAFFMMENAEHFLEKTDMGWPERSRLLSEAVEWEARVIGETAVEEIRKELEQAGIELSDGLAVSGFYDEWHPALDDEIEKAEEKRAEQSQERDVEPGNRENAEEYYCNLAYM